MENVQDLRYISYIVIGYYYNTNKKFRNEYSNRFTAMSINLWNGRVWGILSNGKRKLLKTVIN